MRIIKENVSKKKAAEASKNDQTDDQANWKKLKIEGATGILKNQSGY